MEKERDSQKHQLEEIIRVLKNRDIYLDIIREVNGG